MTATEQEVDQYSKAITDAFTRLWRRYRPEMHRVPSSTEQAITQLANELHRLQINPHNYVQFVFEYHARFTGSVCFNMIASPKSIAHYLEVRPEREQELAVLIKVQTGKVEDLLSSGKTLRDILTDYTQPLSAVYRYALANSTGEFDLCEIFKEDAERMLLFEPLYAKLLGRLLPKEMLDV